MYNSIMSVNIGSLDHLTAPGTLFEKLPGDTVRCQACAHRCVIHTGKRGICQVRFNQDGILRVPWGYVAGIAADPIEKKPFYHFLPGADALTFGMLGCNFHCNFCQNWISSQVWRDPAAAMEKPSIQMASAEQIVNAARRNGAAVIASSYNEPLITSEWAVGIFKLAQPEGIRCVYVSNGYATPEVLESLRPTLAGFKVDLKTMQDQHYRECGGTLQHVLDTIQRAYTLGLWVEVVTLVIPDFNDSVEELWDAARFLVSVSADIPWHVTAFHPDYKMTDRSSTPASSLQRAAEIGQEAGLHYVYAGNLPGRVRNLEDTHCPNCQQILIRRRGFTLSEYHLTSEGACPKCHTHIAGVWTDKPDTVNVGGQVRIN